MARTGQSFSMYSGDSKVIYVNIRDRVGKEVKLSNATLKWVMKQRGRTIVDKEIGNGLSIVDADKGRVSIRLMPPDTEGVAGDCEHHLKLIDGDGMETTVTTGTIHIESSLHSG